MSYQRTLTILWTLALILVASIAIADVPQMINYQGRLVETDGTPVENGSYQMNFKIYGSDTGDDSLWWSGFQGVEVTGGSFDYKLGFNSPLPDDLFQTGTIRWLGVTVESDPEITPRTQLVSMPYSYQALRSDSADFATDADHAIMAEEAMMLEGLPGAYYLDWNNLTGIPPGFADGIDDVGTGGGDITGVTADNGLTGGGTTGDVTLYIDSTWVDSFVDSSDTRYSDSTAIAATARFSDSTESITDGAVDFADVGQNSATSGQVMKWNGSAWAVADDETGSGNVSGWVDDGNAVRLETIDDSVGIGTVSPNEKLEVVGNIRVTGKASIGSGNTNTGTFTFVAGNNNDANGGQSSVGGGSANVADGNYSIISGGQNNTTTGNWSTVGGGNNNDASAQYAVVSGGGNNFAQNSGTVGGGTYNSAGVYSTVPGGNHNNITSNYSAIGGGRNNEVQGEYSVIPGGYADTITSTANYSYLLGIGSRLTTDSTFMVDMPHIRFGDESDGYEFPSSDGTADQYLSTDGSGQLSWSDAGGGNWTVTDSVLYTNNYWGIARGSVGNLLRGDSAHTHVNLGVACTTGNTTVGNGFCTVGGGLNNDAHAAFSTICGGENNLSTGTYAAIAGGLDNYVTGYSSVGGGQNNTANGPWSVVAGGHNNSAGTMAFEWYCTVGGGRHDTAAGNGSTVAGGENNRAGVPYQDYSHATVSGGMNNTASDYYSTIGGGRDNAASGEYSIIGGGSRDTASGDYASVPGGRLNSATGDYSFAAGRRAKALHDGAFVWADTTDANFASTVANQMSIRAENGVRIATDAGGSKTTDVGERYRDNGIIAWGSIYSNGVVAGSYGVSNVTRNSAGNYTITMTASSATVTCAVVSPEIDAHPTSAAAARLASVDAINATTINVYITNGSYAAVDNDFQFVVTAR